MKYERVELEKLTVHRLREKAKAIGVKSPTSLTKNQLISNIIGICNGEILPYFSKRGRPFKNYELTKEELAEKLNEKLEKVEKLFEQFKKEVISVLLQE